MKALRLIYMAGWIVLLAIFAGRTFPVLARDLSRCRISTPSPDASLDGLLEPLLRVTHPSARLALILDKVPANGTILFVSARGDDRWDFVYSAVCYLTWPRPIEREELPMAGARRDPSAFQAIVYCGETEAPRPAARGVSLGPNLRVELARSLE
jgi:hypothetical protein